MLFARRSSVVAAFRQHRCNACRPCRELPLPPPTGPLIEVAKLTGVYADPHGGVVRLTLDGVDTFRLKHSLYGHIPTCGAIYERYIEMQGLRATFNGTELRWENDIVAPRIASIDAFENKTMAKADKPVAAKTPTEIIAMNEILDDVVQGSGTSELDELGDFDPAAALHNLHVVLGVSPIDVLRVKSRISSADPPGWLIFVDKMLTWCLGSPAIGLRSGLEMWSLNLVKLLQPWSNAGPRGSRLFVKGLGTFDIRAAQERHMQQVVHSKLLSEAFKQVVQEDVDEEPACTPHFRDVISAVLEKSMMSMMDHMCQAEPGLRQLESLLPSPAELQAHGYAPYDHLGLDIAIHDLVEIFGLAENDFRFRFFVQHHKWFFACHEHFNRVDEVMRLPADLPAELLMRAQPRRILDAGLQIRQQRRGVGCFIQIDWLQQLPDKQCASGRKLVPLRSSNEFEEVGRALQNCAADLIDDVQHRECLLVKLLDKNGVPLALGRFQKTRWVEMSGKRNSNVGMDFRADFEEWNTDLRDWWAQHVGEHHNARG